MHSARGDTPSRVPGSPIRTPPDQRSVDSSPGPIAASHVLHRLLVPRHPPCALTHLHTRHTQPGPTRHTPARGAGGVHVQTNIKALQQKPRIIILIQDARIHYPVLKHPTETPHPPRHQPNPHHQQASPARSQATHQRREADGMSAGADPRPKKQPTPTPPTGQDPHPPPAHSGRQDQGQQGAGPVSSGPNSAPSPTPPHRPRRRHVTGPGREGA